MIQLTEHEREQLRFWQVMAHQHLQGSAYLFRALECTELTHPVPVYKHSNRLLKGIVVSLLVHESHHWAQHLPDGLGWLPEEPPQQTLRLPCAYVLLLCNGK